MTDWRRPVFKREGDHIFAHARWETSRWIDLGLFKCNQGYRSENICHSLGCPLHHPESSWPVHEAILQFRALEESANVATTY